MKSRQTFKFQLTLHYSISFFILIIILGISSYTGLKQILLYNLDKNLNVIAASEADFATHTKSLHLHDIKNVLPDSHSKNASLKRYTQITELSGKLVVANHHLKEQPLPLEHSILTLNAQEKHKYVTIQYQNQPYRMLYLPFTKNNQIYSLQVATPLSPLMTTLWSIMKMYLSCSFATLLLAIFTGAILANRAVKPILSMTKTAQMVSLKTLDKRIPIHPKTQVEFSELAIVFNEMFERLEHSVQALQRFTSDASHELRTPLTILKGEMQVALRKPRTQQEYIEILESGIEEVNRLIKLSHSLLLLYQVESGTHEHLDSLGVCHMNKTIETVVKRFLIKTEENKLSLDTQLSNPDPQVNISETHLVQVLSNLLDNAIKATSPGGSITIHTKIKEGFGQIDVTDSGCGISPKDLKYIFDRFYQVDAARSENRESFGIGLSICQAIIQKYDGSITVNSELKQGTRFSVRLPII